MASSAAQPISQSYQAGDCRLDVLFAPSALSQWSNRPIVETLTFQLWLGCNEEKEETEGENSRKEETLIAEGDRAQLQAIAQYFQARTRNVLALSPSTAASDSPVPVEPPLGLQLGRSTSYLQLSDITTVLAQYEQANKTLPVALRETLSDVIPLESVRSAEDSRPSVLLEATRERSARNRFATTSRRSRRKTGLWASSAAAALFVVGITTTLISRDPTLQEVGITSDTPILDSQTEASRSDETTPFEISSPDALEERAEEKLPAESNRTRTPTPESNGSFSNRPAPLRLPPSENSSSGNVAQSRPERTESDVQSSSDISDAEVSEPAISESDTSAGAPSVQLPNARPETSNDESIDSPSESLSGVPRRTAESESLPEATSPSAPSPAPSDRAPDRAPPDRSTGASRTDTGEESTSRSSTARSTSDPATQSAEEDAFDTESLRTERAQPEGSSAAPPASPLPTSDAATSDPEAVEAPLEATPIGLSGQIQSYFQQRLLSSGLNAVEVGPLTYRLQVSEAGEVIVFVALDDISETYRDVLFPGENSPVFAIDSGSAEAVSTRTFRVLFNQNGVVEVSPI